MAMFRDAIETFIPKKVEQEISALSVDFAGVKLITNNCKVEQEPNKVELVPLDDIDSLADYIKFAAMAHGGDELKWHMRAVLSKY